MDAIKNELGVTREEKRNILEELNNTKQQMKADLNAAGKETKRLKEVAREKDKTIRDLEEKYKRLEHKCKELERQLKEASEMAEVKQKLETIEKEKKKIEKELSVEKEKNSKLSKEYKELEDKYEQLQREHETALTRIEEMQRQLSIHDVTAPPVEVMMATSRPRSAQIREQLRKEKKKIQEESDKTNKLISSAVKGSSIPKAHVFSYRSDFDKKGVIYALGTNFGDNKHWVNPGGTDVENPITVTRSSSCLGEAKDLLWSYDRKKIEPSSTEAAEMSWWCVDLGEKLSLFLTHYTLRHGRNNPESYLRNWNLEGSHDGENWSMETILDTQRDHKWHPNEFPCMTQTWPIEDKKKGQEAYRFFRIVQTDKNSSGRFDIYLSGMELYGVLLDMSPVSN